MEAMPQVKLPLPTLAAGREPYKRWIDLELLVWIWLAPLDLVDPQGPHFSTEMDDRRIPGILGEKRKHLCSTGLCHQGTCESLLGEDHRL